MRTIKTCRILPVFAVVLALLMSCTASAAPLDAVASNIKGAVDRSTDGGPWRGIRNHEKLKVGYNVRTGPQSSIILTYDDGNVVSLMELTQVRIDKLDRSGRTAQSSLSLKEGRLLAFSKRLQTPESVFEIKTPNGTGGVRGTEMAVTVSEESTVFAVTTGALEIELDGKTSTLEAGFQMEILADMVEFPLPTAIDPTIFQNLTTEIQTHKQAGDTAGSIIQSEDDSSEELDDLSSHLDFIHPQCTSWCPSTGVCLSYN